MSDDYTPSMDRIAHLYSWAYAWRTRDDDETDLSGTRATQRAEFDRALEAHDRQVAAKTTADIVARVRQSCTPSTEAYTKGGDFLIYAVAGWIEDPPEWVNAPWVGRGRPIPPGPPEPPRPPAGTPVS